MPKFRSISFAFLFLLLSASNAWCEYAGNPEEPGVPDMILVALLEVASFVARFLAPIADYFLGFLVNFCYFFGAWLFFGKDPKATETLIPLFHPPLAGYYRSFGAASDEEPSRMSPAAIDFVLNDAKLSDKGFSSLFLALATRGLCSISSGDGVFAVRLIDAPEALEAASAEERALYSMLVEQGGFDRPFEVSLRNTGSLSAMRSGVVAKLRERYGGLWAHNRAIVAIGWRVVLPLSVLLACPWFMGGVWRMILFFILYAVIMGAASAAAGLLAVAGRFLRRLLTVLFGSVIAAVCSIIGLAGLLLLTLHTAEHSNSIGVALVLIFLNLFIFGLLPLLVPPLIFVPLMGAPSRAGQNLKVQIQGFSMYLQAAEQDRVAALGAPDISPETVQRMLPYIVALGLENKWGSRFAELFALGVADSNLEALDSIRLFTREFRRAEGEGEGA